MFSTSPFSLLIISYLVPAQYSIDTALFCDVFWCVVDWKLLSFGWSQILLKVEVLSTNEWFKDGRWKSALLPYYAHIGTMTKENIQKVYLDCTPDFRTVKKVFRGFRQSDFNRNGQLRSGQTSDVDEDALLLNVVNKTNISTEEVARFWKSISHLPFTIWRDLCWRKTADFGKLKRFHFPSCTLYIHLTWLLPIYIYSALYRVI